MNIKLLIGLLFLPAILSAQLIAKPAGTAGPIGFYQFLPPSFNASGSYKYPLIINMHGQGESGNGTTDLPLVLKYGLGKLLTTSPTLTFTERGQRHAFVVLCPQMDPAYAYISWQNFYIDSMINYAKKNLNIDVNKIFLTGYSLGGGGAWKYPTESINNANIIAGVIPVAASPDYTNLCNIAQGKVAVWAHHSADDDAIPVRFTDSAIRLIQNCSPVIAPMYSRYPTGKHDASWVWAYDTLNNIQYPNMFQWMIGTSRANTPQNNQAPVASAGNDSTVIVPSVNAVLNGAGSYDPNDVIVKYAWRKISGPASYNIENPQAPVTKVSSLQAGSYAFELSVTDEFGIVRTDAVTINVITGVLPVEINYFKGKSISKANMLNWRTEQELNVKDFIIFRSSDGKEFLPVGTVPAGHTVYTFTDNDAPAGISYYRLKQVDQDGKFTLSKIITINNTNRVLNVEKYPNPVKDKLNLVLEGSVQGSFEISVYDLQGKLMKKQTVNKQLPVWKGFVNTGNLQKGVYSLEVTSGSGLRESGTFIKD